MMEPVVTHPGYARSGSMLCVSGRLRPLLRQKRLDAVRIGPIKAIFRHIIGDYGVFVA